MNFMLADAVAGSPSATVICLVIGLLLSAGANAATIMLAVAAFRKNKTEVSFGFEPASKSDFDNHVKSNDTDQLQVWREINELKKENLALTKTVGEMSSRILADLANAQRLRAHH